MAVDQLFRGRVLSILQARGQPFANDTTDYQIQVNGDTIALTIWNVAKLGAVPTAAQIGAVTDAQANAAVTALARLEAQFVIDTMPIFEKAIILTLLDETNRLRTALRGLGVTGLPNIDVPTMIQAVRNKAGTL